jgi:hypothetical protein
MSGHKTGQTTSQPFLTHKRSRAPQRALWFGMAELLAGYVQSGHLAAYVFVYLTARRLLSLRACSHGWVKGHEGVAGTKLGLEPDGPPVGVNGQPDAALWVWWPECGKAEFSGSCPT